MQIHAGLHGQSRFEGHLKVPWCSTVGILRERSEYFFPVG